MTRSSGVGSLVKTATHFVAQVHGGERLVLQAVKDMLDELRDLRRKNASLQRENDKLRARVERMQQAQARRKAS
jgi:cell division protein FtsB